MKNTLFATTALAFVAASALILAPVANAANGSWTKVFEDMRTKTEVWGISSTTDLNTPPVVVAKEGSKVEAVVGTASDTVVVRGLRTLVSTSTVAPSGTIPGVSGTATAAAGTTLTLSERTESGPQKFGLNVDISGTGALWSAYMKITGLPQVQKVKNK